MLEVVALDTFLLDKFDREEAGLGVGVVWAKDTVDFAAGCFDG